MHEWSIGGHLLASIMQKKKKGGGGAILSIWLFNFMQEIKTKLMEPEAVS